MKGANHEEGQGLRRRGPGRVSKRTLRCGILGWGLMFRFGVWGLGCGVWGVVFEVWGSSLEVGMWGEGCEVRTRGRRADVESTVNPT